MIKCKECDKEFKTQGAVNLHARHHVMKDVVALPQEATINPNVQTVTVAPVAPTSSPLPSNPNVTFFSPRRASMLVICQPSEWKELATPNGSRLIKTEEKAAQFDAGRFTTDDPIIINYLEQRYKDNRFPVISQRVIAAAAGL